jgi:polyisoprenoid-binding protein YceI
MMKQLVVLWGLVCCSFTAAQDIYVCRNATISFYSSAPIEDIKAVSHKGVSAFNISSKSIYFKVEIRSFEFRKSLMQEHFNSDYMESDQYPFAEFKGKVLDNVDLTKNGVYPVTVQGDLTIHNVTKNYTTRDTIVVNNEKISAHAAFNVRLADHNIKIPRLLIKNIAEQVLVSVDAEYDPAPAN